MFSGVPHSLTPAAPDLSRARKLRLFFAPPAQCGTDHGFTLIEVIMSMVLMGIIVVMAGFGIMQVTNSFTWTRGASAMAGKGQLAILRMMQELTVAKSVSSGTASAITFVAQQGAAATTTYTLSLSGSNLQLADGASTDILCDTVSAFSLAYYDAYNDGTADTTWTASSKIIEPTITLAGPNGITRSFTFRVTPRNL